MNIGDNFIEVGVEESLPFSLDCSIKACRALTLTIFPSLVQRSSLSEYERVQKRVQAREAVQIVESSVIKILSVKPFCVQFAIIQGISAGSEELGSG